MRQLCSIFLDLQSDPEIRVSLAHTAIDKTRNQVIIATWDGGRISDYARAKYGDLALVMPGGRVHEQDGPPGNTMMAKDIRASTSVSQVTVP